MTFIPSVQSKNDPNNSISITGAQTFTGTSTNTNGYIYLSIILTSDKNSIAGGIEIEFSNDNINFTTYYKDTYFTGTQFYKTYQILDTYYRIKYTSDSTSIFDLAEFDIKTRLKTNNNPENNSPNNDYNTLNDSYHDAFGKLRVSMPNTLLDLKFGQANAGTTGFLSNNLVSSYGSTGSGTAVYGNGKVIMSANGATGNYTVQSRKYCIYQPGKSLLYLGSAVINSISNTSTDYTARVGYFDDLNGIFFEYSQDGIAAVLRNNGSDTRYLQNDWNIDTLNGEGTSGYIINWTNAQLFAIDLEWLGVGRIRFGLYIFGKILYCHQITNINTLTEPYMRTANLPVRCELTNNSTGDAYLTQICNTVISEGGYNPIGRPFAISNGITNIATSSNVETPILAIRGNSATASITNNRYYHQNIIPSLITVFDTANTNYIYRVRLYLAPNSPTVTTWNSVDNESIVEYALGGGNITDITNTNIIVSSAYGTEKSSTAIQSLSNIFSNEIQITSNINNISDVLLVTMQTISGNGDAYCTINWNEVY